MSMVFDFIQTACVLIVLSYLLSRANFFSHAGGTETLTKGKLAVTAAVFAFIALYGVIIRASLASGMHVDTRIAGIALAGLLFGYLPSALAALPTVLVSLFLREQTLVADLLSMALAFGLSGLCHRRFPDFDAVLSGIIVGALEVCHMLLIVFTVRPAAAAKAIVYSISFPMIVVNGLAVIAFVLIITDINERRRLWEKESFSRSEFLVAKNIQSSLLETDFDVDPRLDLSAYLTPALDVGGDLYCFLTVGGRYFRFIIGDVSGKGVPASIIMSRCETLFRELAPRTDSPAELLSALNQRLCRNNRAQMFVTACAGSLDLRTGRLVYANAGHVTPYLIAADSPALALQRPKGKPLGVAPRGSYETAEAVLAPGQLFLSYTDGVTEAENTEKQLFGSARLEQALDRLPAVSAAQIQETLLAAVRAHSAGAAQSDDIAVFAFGPKAAPLHYVLPNTIPDFIETAVQINADLAACGAAQRFADDAGLVLEELVSNIIKFGYGDGRRGEISVSLWPEDALLLIEDDSDAFDPFAADSPNASLPPAERSIGGMGIFLTKKRALSHSYESADGINSLLIRLRESGVTA